MSKDASAELVVRGECRGKQWKEPAIYAPVLEVPQEEVD